MLQNPNNYASFRLIDSQVTAPKRTLVQIELTPKLTPENTVDNSSITDNRAMVGRSRDRAHSVGRRIDFPQIRRVLHFLESTPGR